MAVYLDLVMGLNFLVDFFLLLGTNRLAGFPLGARRCALAAVLGGLYSGACMLPGFRFLGSMLWRAVSLGVMGMLAFGLERSSLKRTGVFLLLSLALGGLAVSLGRGDFLSLVLGAGGVGFLCHVAFGTPIGQQEYLAVAVRHGGSTERFTALRDSGNSLRDPITGESVLVVSAAIGEKLTGLTRQQMAAPLETLAKMPGMGLRLIPYRAIGAGGMLLGMKFEDVTIGSHRGRAIVAFAPEGLGEGYQALTGGAL